MFDVLLPLLYVFLFGNVIYRARFFALSPGRVFLLNIFIIKCLLSALYWQVHVNDYGGGDIFYYFLNGEIIGKTLQSGPWKYIHLVFGYNGVTPPPPDIEREIDLMGFWYDTSAYMVVRFNALVYLFSFGNPYVHGVFISFLSLTGLTALYKGIMRVVDDDRPWLRFAVFGIPSVLFWTSGVHKEGLLIFGLGFFFYSLLSIRPGARNLKYINMLILSSIFIFLVRDFVFYLLLPGLFAWQVAKVWPRYGPVIMLASYVFFVFGGAYLDILPGKKNYLNMIVDKQYRFNYHMGGKTDIDITKFQPSVMGVIKQTPEALYNTTLRPLSLGFVPVSHSLIFFESLFLLLIVILSIAFFDYRHLHFNLLMAWMFSFGITLLVLIGIIVPNIGAIVRYRSLALPFIFIPLLFFIKPSVITKIRLLTDRFLDIL